MIGRLIFLGYFTFVSVASMVITLMSEEVMDVETLVMYLIVYGVMILLPGRAFIKNWKFYRSPEYEAYKTEKEIKKGKREAERYLKKLEKRPVEHKTSKAGKVAVLGIGSVAYVTLGTIAKLTSKYK